MRLTLRQLYFALRERFNEVNISLLDVCRHKLSGLALKRLRRQSAISEARVESICLKLPACMLRDQTFQENCPIGDGRNHAIVRGVAPNIAHPTSAGNVLLFAKLESS